MGGIRTGADALQFLLAGASAVCVGTAVFNDPSAPARISGELRTELQARGFSSVREAVGFAHWSAEDQSAFWFARAGADPLGTLA
jgi:dihydroorotate dehydrogenase (NAD+) catalytic subunit